MTKISNQYSLTNILTADLANSRLGINNVSPTVALDVTGAGKFSSSVSATSYNATTQNIFAVDGSEKMRITSGGLVGIGTTTVSSLLTLSQSAFNKTTLGDARVIRLENSDPTVQLNSRQEIGFGYSTAYQPVVIGHQITNNTDFTNGSFYVAVRSGVGNTAPVQALTVIPGGNVGIGTSSPSQKLEVIGTTKLSSAAGNVTGINIIPDSQTNIYQTVGETTNGPNGLVRFYANIVTGWANYDNWGSSYMDFKVQSRGTGTSDQSSVAMGIRPTLDIRMTNLSGSGSRAVMADANGQLSASVSDITLKENITPIGYGLNEIMQMNPVWFDFVDGYKNYGEGRQNGNIAQEIAEIIPEAVFTTPQTGKMGINYEQLHAVYIKAIQELKAEIDILKNK